MIKYLVFLDSAWVQLSRTGKKWISVIVAIRPVFPDPVTYILQLNFPSDHVTLNNKILYNKAKLTHTETKFKAKFSRFAH